MGQRSVRYVPPGRSKVYNRNGTQATIINVQQTVSKSPPPPPALKGGLWTCRMWTLK